jgi:uncharacterized protein (DUF58 family)
MRPGPRLVRALVLLALTTALVPVVPVAAWAVLSGLLVVLGASAAEASRLRRCRVTAERAPAETLDLDEPEELPLALRTDAPWPVSMSVRQVWPDLVEARETTRDGVCRPGEVLSLRLPVRGIARGEEALVPPVVSVTAWGLVERILTVGETASLRVIPNLRAVRRLHGQLNQFALRGLGNRMAPRLGKGREFDRLRDYGIDDDFRDIAWKASARHGHLIVREFRLDRSQDVVVCIDRGHRMAARMARLTKVDHAVNAAVVVAYLCNRMEDRVGILSFGAEVEKGIAQGRGYAHLRQITAFASGIRPEYIHTDYLALAAHLRRRIRHRALILILTDLPEGDARFDLLKAVRLLTPTHLPLIAAVTDPDLRAAGRILPGDHAELCRTLVARDVWTERQQTIRDLRRRGALVLETTPEEVGVDAMNAYIDVKRRQLL